MMEAFGMYLTKSAVWLTGFTLIYLLFLRNERYFGLNRTFLLLGIFASILFPLFTWHYAVVLPPMPVEEISVPEETQVMTYVAPAATPKVPFYWWIYILGFACLALRLILQTFKVVRRLQKSGYEKNGSVKLVRTPEYSASFSFFSFVFVNPSTSDIEAQEIMNHESGHIQNRHWFDLLLMEFLRILQWFNPFVWIYARLVRQNHEYLADEIALQRTSDPAVYQAALLNQVFGVPVISLANSFSSSLNNKRFTMMKKKIHSPFRKLKLLMALPLIALVFYAFAKPEYVESTTNTDNINNVSKEGKVKGTVTNEKGNPLEGVAVIIRGTTTGTLTDANGDFVLKNVPQDAELEFSYVGLKTQKLKPDFDHRMSVQLGVSIISIDKREETSFENPDDVKVIGYGEQKKDEPNSLNKDKSSLVALEQRPEFPGGPIALFKFLHENIKYPSIAKEKKIEGTVMINFMVNKRGKVKEVRVTRGIQEDMDAEAIRVVHSMPDWIPGKQNGKPVDVHYSINVEFTLKDSDKGHVNLKLYQFAPTLILLDGKVITQEEMDKLNPNTIESFKILKSESAIRIYGEKGKYGAIIITSKRGYESDGLNSEKNKQSTGSFQSNGLYFYREIDEKPQFPGGKTEMMRFLMRNLKFPVIASEKGVEGTALVRFTVTKTGQIDNASVINDIDPSLKSEAVRSIMKMPVWDPGKKEGKAIDVVCTIPLKFINKSGNQQPAAESRSLSGDFSEVLVIGYGKSPKDTSYRFRSPEAPFAEKDKPFVNVEQMPEFPGGTKEMMKYIQDNLKYPPEAKAQGIQGTVIIRFVVTSSGKPDQMTLMRGVNPLLDDEAMRVIKSSPDWIPGKQGGKAVDVYYTIPVRFVLSPSSSSSTPPPPPPSSENN